MLLYNADIRFGNASSDKFGYIFVYVYIVCKVMSTCIFLVWDINETSAGCNWLRFRKCLIQQALFISCAAAEIADKKVPFSSSVPVHTIRRIHWLLVSEVVASGRASPLTSERKQFQTVSNSEGKWDASPIFLANFIKTIYSAGVRPQIGGLSYNNSFPASSARCRVVELAVCVYWLFLFTVEQWPSRIKTVSSLAGHHDVTMKRQRCVLGDFSRIYRRFYTYEAPQNRGFSM
jgi:hypothetical protein